MFDPDKIARQIAYGNTTVEAAKRNLTPGQKSALTKALKKREELKGARQEAVNEYVDEFNKKSRDEQCRELLTLVR